MPHRNSLRIAGRAGGAKETCQGRHRMAPRDLTHKSMKAFLLRSKDSDEIEGRDEDEAKAGGRATTLVTL